MTAETSERAHRLHPASMVFVMGRSVRGLIVPAAIAILFARGDFHPWMLLLLVPAAIAAAVQYASYRYRLGDRELVVREGIFTRNERHVPYDRIDNINLVRNPLHRMLGVAEVRVETASGAEPEAVMRVLSMSAVERLRAGVFADREPRPRRGAGGETTDAIPDARALLRLGIGELLLFGVVSGRGMVLLAAAFGFVWQFQPVEIPSDPRIVAGWLEQRVGQVPIPGALVTMIAVVVIAVAALVLLRGLAAIWAVLRYYDFTLTRRGEDLRAEYGLFTRITATVPRRRIQLLSVLRGPWHRLVRRASVRAESAGGRDGEEASTGTRWLAPLIVYGRVADLVREAIPDVDLAGIEWIPLPPRARSRIARRGILLGLAVTAVLTLNLGLKGLLILPPAVALAVVHAVLYVRHAAWGDSEEWVAFRSGWWRRYVSVVRAAKVQVVEVRQSPFDRRARMAGVEVDTAGAGKTGHRVRIPMMSENDARALAARLQRRAAATVFQW